MRNLQEGGDLDLSLLPQEPEQAEQWPAPAATVFTDWILRLPCLPHVSKGIQVTLLQTFSRGNNFWKIHIPNIKKRSSFFFLDKYSASLQSDYFNISLKARPVTIKKQKSRMETIPISLWVRWLLKCLHHPVDFTTGRGAAQPEVPPPQFREGGEVTEAQEGPTARGMRTSLWRLYLS